MKLTILVLTILFSIPSFAELTDSNFASLIQRHGTMVNNDGETFLNASIVKSEEATELSDVIHKIVEESLWGLNTLNMRPFHTENTKKDLVQLLTGGDYPFFCVTFEKELEWTDDAKRCEGRLHMLLGKAVERADKVTVIEMSGNYYGIWGMTVVVLQNFETKESLVLEFDMIHEI